MPGAGPTLDVRFWVDAIPVPKGSHQAFPISRGKCRECKPGAPCRSRSCFHGTIVGCVVSDQQGGELEAWEQLVKVRAMSARNAAGHRLVARPGSVSISMVFVLPRPAGHWTDSGALTADGRRQPVPSVKPDVDKLVRATFDGMTKILAEDDSQFFIGKEAKVYAQWKGKPGAVVHATQTSELEPWVIEELAFAGMAPVRAQGSLL